MALAKWAGKLSESVYETDDYTYRHVHLPRNCKLGPQWQHYGWHGPEPHILLFRRPKQPKVPVLETFPRTPDNNKTLRDRIQQLESELQDSKDRIAELQLESELRESKAQEHQNRIAELRSSQEDLRQKVSQYEEEGLALRQGRTALQVAFQKQAEQLLFTSEATLPWDERMAARGLSPKLHWWQIPEIRGFASLCEDMFAHLSEACVGRAPTIMSILSLIARGVRGAKGLAIVRKAALSQTGLAFLSSEACPQDIVSNLSKLVLHLARQTTKNKTTKKQLVFGSSPRQACHVQRGAFSGRCADQYWQTGSGLSD